MTLSAFDQPDTVTCDECLIDVPEHKAIITPFGRFCSDECATDSEADYFDHMEQRGYTISQPDMLAKERF
jgi:hypothetical protein